MQDARATPCRRPVTGRYTMRRQGAEVAHWDCPWLFVRGSAVFLNSLLPIYLSSILTDRLVETGLSASSWRSP